MKPPPSTVVQPAAPRQLSPAPVAIEPREATACPALSVSAATCASQLDIIQRELRARDEARMVREGTAVLQPKAASAPRFTPRVVREAVELAFTQTKVPGGVQGIDCAEYPCIVFGRIRGAEDKMEKLEEARALSAYDEDILTVLVWSATDEAAREQPLLGTKDRAEQSLFAMAIYPRIDDKPVADNLDRRIRSRTAELWNTMSPADETGR